MKVFIIHGTGGSPDGNWFSWLKSELEKLGCEVFLPKFPTPNGQSLDSWMGVFDNYLDKVDEDTIFVGHSLGPAFLLYILETIDIQIKAAYFVSGFLSLLGDEWFDTRNKTFVCRDFDWDKIKSKCKKFVVISGDNDPYVPLDEAQPMKRQLAKLPDKPRCLP